MYDACERLLPLGCLKHTGECSHGWRHEHDRVACVTSVSLQLCHDLLRYLQWECSAYTAALLGDVLQAMNKDHDFLMRHKVSSTLA